MKAMWRRSMARNGKRINCEGDFWGWKLADMPELQAGGLMTEQNRKYITKEIGKLLSEIWRIKGLAEPGVRPAAPDHKEAEQYACRCPGTATGRTWLTCAALLHLCS